MVVGGEDPDGRGAGPVHPDNDIGPPTVSHTSEELGGGLDGLYPRAARHHTLSP
jgi:hypothetical protein